MYLFLSIFNFRPKNLSQKNKIYITKVKNKHRKYGLKLNQFNQRNAFYIYLNTIQGFYSSCVYDVIFLAIPSQKLRSEFYILIICLLISIHSISSLAHLFSWIFVCFINWTDSWSWFACSKKCICMLTIQLSFFCHALAVWKFNPSLL